MDTFSKNTSVITPTTLHMGKRVDQFLAHSQEFQNIVGRKLSRAEIQRAIKEGAITSPSGRLAPHTLVREKMSLFIAPKKFAPEMAQLISLNQLSIPIQIQAQTDDFWVLEKPAGIQVHPSTTKHEDTISNWVASHSNKAFFEHNNSERPGIVHRLDKETSGLLLVAKNQAAQEALKRIFHDRLIQKTYLALVFGHPAEHSESITTPLARSSRGNRQQAVLPGRRTKGVIREAETEYTVLETFSNASLIEARPHTGRTHQIRVHLASIGHPVLGDTLYASKGSKAFSKKNKVPRHLLHAQKLSFTFFETSYTFSSSLPQDFQMIVERFRAASQRK